MAFDNNDVVELGVRQYNVDRLQQFIYNVANNIPDKIIVTVYGIDGYPTICILQYNGDIIIFTQRYNFNNKTSYMAYYGRNIIIRTRLKEDGIIIRDYILQTINNKEVYIIHERLLNE